MEAVLARLTRMTPYTVTQPARLVEQLERVRKDGYATTVEEMTLGACSVAVPVFAPAPVGEAVRVVAALGVVVPSLKRDRARLVAAMDVAARGIERNLNDLRDRLDPS